MHKWIYIILLFIYIYIHTMKRSGVCLSMEVWRNECKQYEGTFWSDGNVLYHDWAGDYTSIYLLKFIVLKMQTQNVYTSLFISCSSKQYFLTCRFLGVPRVYYISRQCIINSRWKWECYLFCCCKQERAYLWKGKRIHMGGDL